MVVEAAHGSSGSEGGASPPVAEMVRFEGGAGPEAPDLAFVTDIVAASAAAMDGRLAVHAGADGTRYVLALPRSGAP